MEWITTPEAQEDATRREIAQLDRDIARHQDSRYVVDSDEWVLYGRALRRYRRQLEERLAAT